MLGQDSEMNKDDDCENLGLGCALEHFAEVEEVLTMIDNLKNIYNTKEFEVQYDKLYAILKQYYEQPHLLDPHLDNILGKFLSLIKDKESPVELKHATFNYMYQIIRVRGYKIVVRHLPHEVSDLLTVLTFLETQDPQDKEMWRSRFVLLLWLSIIVIIPFHMSRLDGFTPGQEGCSEKLTVMERIFNLCKTYALTTDACAEAGAYLTSKFLIRSDVKELYMETFFDWACELTSNLNDGTPIHYGVLAAVATVLKHGKREDLLPYADKLLDWVTKQNYRQHYAKLVRKYGVKIVQRIGLIYLRPRVASWRYTRGSRSLAHTLGFTPTSPPESETTTEHEEDYSDIPQQVEDVVELLLGSLDDEDSVVRWSGAKGVGRVGARLPAAAAADVAGAVLQLARHARDAACHGACLALAELARRGLLAPAQVAAAAAAVGSALRRVEARGAGGAGAGGGRAARDAACHLAWAFARAYPAPVLAPHAEALAAALLAAACFDREVNCRRAASAAFQENVGRHGLFPRGIEVLTAADFQSVGPRAGAFLRVAPAAAAHPFYARALLDHLLQLKAGHWDAAVRELAAKALAALAPKMPDYVAKEILPKLVANVESVDVNVRHGSILGIGETMYALFLISESDKSSGINLVSEEVFTSVRKLVHSVRMRQHLRGLGGELMRQACCSAIAALSRAKVPFHSEPVIDDWLNLIEECLSHEVHVVREKAIEALPLVFEEYLRHDNLEYDGVKCKDKRTQLVTKYCEQLSNTGVNGLLLRMGFSRALGSLPKFVLYEHFDLIIQSLIDCTKIGETTLKWAESRRDAVIGLTSVCEALGEPGEPLFEKHSTPIFEAFLAAMDEYTLDLRGDVGAWVREASMTGLVALCCRGARGARGARGSRGAEARGGEGGAAGRRGEWGALAAGALAQQAVEKIDRTRAHAARLFVKLLYSDPAIPNIPHHEELKKIFPQEDVDLKPAKDVEQEDLDHGDIKPSESSNVVLWLFAEHTMPRFVQMLNFPIYRYHVIKGLVVSAGEMTESLVKHTTQSLFSYLNSIHDDKQKLSDICDIIIQVFADNLHVKRITGPIFNFLDRLLSSGAVSPILEDPDSSFASDILKYLKLELRGAKNIYKLLDSINVLCQLIQVGGAVGERALGRMAVCLCYADSYVRRSAAARLYEALALYGDALPEAARALDQVMSTLADTDWEQDVATLRPIRNNLCDLMNIKCPVPIQASKPSS